MVVIKLNKKNHTITVKQSTSKKITIAKTKNNTIKINHVGRKGQKGDAGIGLPTGGTIGQVLSKSSSPDYDYYWSSSNIADKHYRTTFTVSSTVNVTHNLDKYPAVVVMDSAGQVVEGTVTHLNVNELNVEFTAPFSGTVICN